VNVPAEATRIAAELRAAGLPDRAINEKRYLKSDFVHFGVPVPTIRKTAVAAARACRSRTGVRALADALWSFTEDGTPVHETRVAAIEVLIRRVELLQPPDLHLAERLIRDSASWVYVDNLAEKLVGGLITRFPETVTTLDVWVSDPYTWIRRTALLALLPGIRTGSPDLARLTRYGDLLIDESEFFIRKALGWVLRELSKKDPTWVRDWVTARTGRISGVTIREATRHLPPPDADRLLTAYRSGRR
jgi:3-methyladenine DNA glycosylase AlkD